MSFTYDSTSLLITFIGMGLVTYIPRALPIQLLANRKLPESVTTWLSFVPCAVLSALLAPGLLLQNQELFISTDNLFLLAAIPTFLVARYTGSFFGTVAVGMGTVALARFIAL